MWILYSLLFLSTKNLSPILITSSKYFYEIKTMFDINQFQTIYIYRKNSEK